MPQYLVAVDRKCAMYTAHLAPRVPILPGGRRSTADLRNPARRAFEPPAMLNHESRIAASSAAPSLAACVSTSRNAASAVALPHRLQELVLPDG
jgi:hypothetical protein